MATIFLIAIIVAVYVETMSDIIMQLKLEDSHKETSQTISNLFEDSLEAVLIFEKPAE